MAYHIGTSPVEVVAGPFFEPTLTLEVTFGYSYMPICFVPGASGLRSGS